MDFPHLYECSVCNKPVNVTVLGEGLEPRIVRTCEHAGAKVWANRKVTLYGKGEVNAVTKSIRNVKLSVRQLLSFLLKRSI